MSNGFKKQRRSDDHAGIDDWLMTYADMITLLLCFFAVFLSVSVPKKEIFDQAREKMLEQFAAPNIMDGMFPSPPAPSQSGGTYNSLPSIVDRFHSGEGRSVGEGVDAGEGKSEGTGEGEQDSVNSADPMSIIEREARQKEINERQQQQREERGSEADAEGDRITTIDIPSGAFFTSGSAELSQDGKDLLSNIIDTQLRAATEEGYQITIEGHTDDVPISTLQFPSNWELSTARAAAVTRFFIEKGVDPKFLRASGYADVFPKAPNRDESGNPLPENRAQNRRVVIKLEKIERQ